MEHLWEYGIEVNLPVIAIWKKRTGLLVPLFSFFLAEMIMAATKPALTRGKPLKFCPFSLFPPPYLRTTGKPDGNRPATS